MANNEDVVVAMDVENDCCTDGVCALDISPEEMATELLKCKLFAFDKAIEESGDLAIDGLTLNGQACEEVTDDSRFKVLNHNNQEAYEVEVDTVVNTPLNDLVDALKTGRFEPLTGVTRIVGYYSQIKNWNKSKIGELRDRVKGNYWEKARNNTGEIGILD